MGQESAITIQMVNGGFILTGEDTGSGVLRTEVFTSQGKLMKAVRSAIEAGSLIKKEKDESEGGTD